MIALIAALLLGMVAGLRTFTAPAVLWLVRAGGWPAYILAVFAVLEYAGDLHPNAPPRTAAAGLVARVISGGFCGWALTKASGASIVAGVLLGALGAVIGAYGGLAARSRAIALIGRVPAGLLEDAVAIAASIALVVYA
jgi:uncharacterized membrane protein